VLCVGNGAVVVRDGRAWTHQTIATFLADLAEKVGEVCFCAWLDPDDDPLAQAPIGELRGVRAVALPRFDGTAATKWVHGGFALAILLRELLRADFVYLYWPGRLSAVAARICRAIGKPYGIYLRGEPIPPDDLRAALAGARFVLATGDALVAMARQGCHDAESVTPMTTLREKHIRAPRPHADGSPWRLLYVGRIEDRKGAHDLIDALRHLEQWSIPFELTMVGHCYDVPEFRRRISETIARHVRLVGVVADFSQLTEYFVDADVFVLPSHDEGFPRVLYEAMALGVPIVTTFVGSVPNVMKDRVNCLRADVRDPQSIADRIRELVDDSALRAQLATSGTNQVRRLIGGWKLTHAEQVAARIRAMS
jgi:glycosyltransferase involved in cell wall biosynthesis